MGISVTGQNSFSVTPEVRERFLGILGKEKPDIVIKIPIDVVPAVFQARIAHMKEWVSKNEDCQIFWRFASIGIGLISVFPVLSALSSFNEAVSGRDLYSMPTVSIGVPMLLGLVGFRVAGLFWSALKEIGEIKKNLSDLERCSSLLKDKEFCKFVREYGNEFSPSVFVGLGATYANLNRPKNS